MPKVFFLSFMLFLIISCEPNIPFSKNKSLSGVWNKEEVIEFDLPQLDSLKTYNLFVNLRNTNDYKYNNIFLIIAMNFPHGKIVTDTLEYKMANPDGTWLGNGISSIKDNKLWYKEQVSFIEEGIYTVSIKHALRNNGQVEGVTNLEGITDIGFSVAEITQE
ncbi:MAG: gliding motility lipoprotein GldH [Flavobacteriaceae bacterium]|jgi:gliding motility-associated lipoprotein GldH|nr:gliding motility protein GldH [uncultured bacterium]MBT3587812.1 gliding motility lipoprotein GldH [Flavobacteriaceae bacterium]MBT3872058.1 gliding motility lipoprotein GldH [Flavobacteriaceae bacterium]MBT3920470.1 gliding motility lipoprotein GldH [Flavobacteriaceae bacterium]MBT6706188.1 gliding motility lipoprotein GldH [Flavobacteriaceae bacterium]|tara:strand:- start:1543 stop:2028 length:486 start_codon:yes stop_codon:yes gene_type:complete